MTSSELIKILKKYPKDMQVICRSYKCNLMIKDVNGVSEVPMELVDRRYYDEFEERYKTEKSYSYDKNDNANLFLIISDLE